MCAISFVPFLVQGPAVPKMAIATAVLETETARDRDATAIIERAKKLQQAEGNYIIALLTHYGTTAVRARVHRLSVLLSWRSGYRVRQEGVQGTGQLHAVHRPGRHIGSDQGSGPSCRPRARFTLRSCDHTLGLPARHLQGLQRNGYAVQCSAVWRAAALC
jgi:hypothetical protein